MVRGGVSGGFMDTVDRVAETVSSFCHRTAHSGTDSVHVGASVRWASKNWKNSDLRIIFA